MIIINELSGKVININWQNVKHKLFQQLIEDHYVELSHVEAALLHDFLIDDIRYVDSEILSTLIPNAYELVQCLEFFNQWSIAQKTALVDKYLLTKSLDDTKKILYETAARQRRTQEHLSLI